jgi:hypothetical protein
MNRKMCWVVRGVFILAAMLLLSLGNLQAQTPGQIPMFDPGSTPGSCNSSAGGIDCVDSVITQGASGNIGIGTTNPLAPLHLIKDGDYAVGRFETYAATNPDVTSIISLLRARGTPSAPLPVLLGDNLGGIFIGGHFGTGFAERANIVANAAENWSPNGFGTKLRFFTTLNGTTLPDERVVINHDGNVGIGVSAPTFRLQLPNIPDPAGQGLANRWLEFSSRRWKENITPIDHPLEKVARLRGVYYDGTEDKKHNIGIIAEEAGQVLPELVDYEANGTDARGLDYARLTAVLVEAVKELKAENQALKLRIDVLESK